MGIRSFISGLNLLRDNDLVRDFGQRKLHLQVIASIKERYPTSKLHRDVVLVGFREDLLILRGKAQVCEGTVLAFGDAHNGYGRICIGDASWVGQYNNLRAGGGDITIGSGCLISQFCSLVASNHGLDKDFPIQKQPPGEKRGVTLGDDVWLGAGVHILPGVCVNRGAVIGAGSVVTHDVPEFEIWAGAPARKIGQRE